MNILVISNKTHDNLKRCRMRSKTALSGLFCQIKYGGCYAGFIYALTEFFINTLLCSAKSLDVFARLMI